MHEIINKIIVHLTITNKIIVHPIHSRHHMFCKCFRFDGDILISFKTLSITASTIEGRSSSTGLNSTALHNCINGPGISCFSEN